MRRPLERQCCCHLTAKMDVISRERTRARYESVVVVPRSWVDVSSSKPGFRRANHPYQVITGILNVTKPFIGVRSVLMRIHDFVFPWNLSEFQRENSRAFVTFHDTRSRHIGLVCSWMFFTWLPFNKSLFVVPIENKSITTVIYWSITLISTINYLFTRYCER